MGRFFQGEVPKEAAINPDVVDSIIAAELSKLSVEDREKAYLDIHGVSQPKDESPDLIQSSLMEMETAMKELANREAYDLAKSMDPHYVMNDEFRLKFLRADLFNAKKAAIRLCRHFQLKMDLFGADKLALDITQDDLGKEEMDVLYSGYGRILPQHDQTGRLVNVLIANPDHPTEAILRRAFYTATTVQSEDSEAQRRGTVTIAYYLGHGPTSGFNSDISWKMPKMNEGLPMRVVAIHMCYDTGAWTPVHSVVKLAFNTFAKVRIRMHYGSHKECLASLQRHGIKPSIIPISDNGKPADLDSFQQSLRRQRKRERVNKPKRLKIFVPSEYDVLLGRGTPIQNFIGNKRLRSLVLDFQKQYEKAPKGIKIAIAQEIVHLVYQASGMFLKRDGETWITANNYTAKDKVSALFRTNRLQQK
ncbi:unnamed protein product [Cylindrotheca closterium]|uniref:DUF6824 domain-containing protein n=1 Tax=Cylindrotheca closterium TaxID=2856 RepID=A0AAD2CMB9_9STRA|nr:unnamed protein product [Cylindrotheca closterium]